ncbi:MAG: hypothetical protein K8T10_00280 [Candidatus Eremiobacteraeota bacterium]|nr:hypothetical protein [Candidatus Eremiobacteraeota bacterium]
MNILIIIAIIVSIFLLILLFIKRKTTRRKPVVAIKEEPSDKSVFKLKKTSGHPMKYYISLPEGWSPDKKWDVIILVEGRGCKWLKMGKAFARERKNLPFILVVPQAFSNTDIVKREKYFYSDDILEKYEKTGVMSPERLKFDEEGILALTSDIHKEYGGNERFFIAGHSGGGLIIWRLITRHPEKLQATAFGCGCFYNPKPVSDSAGKEDLPIMAFQGEDDKYIVTMNGQWARAKLFCKEYGMKNVDRKIVPGRGHEFFEAEIMEFFSRLIEN